MPDPSDLLLREYLPGSFAVGPRGNMDLVEAATAQETNLFNDDGSVNVVLLRPCTGRGPAGVGGPSGKRVYTEEMLKRDAGVFTGWPCYDNHDSPAARKARMGLPRAPGELAGEIQDSWWEDGVTGPDDADLGLRPGAVVGRFMPGTDLVEGLLRRIPNTLRWSIMGQATGLRPVKAGDPSQGMLVEGIEDDPENSSFDVVTKAGAGGRVKTLVESLTDEDGHSLSGRDYDDPQNGNGDHGDRIDMTDMTLAEALQTDEVRGMFGELVEAAVAEKLPAAVSQAREDAESAVADELKGSRYLRLAGRARTLIEAAKLPGAFESALLEEWGVTDDGTTIVAGPKLALIEAVKEDDKVVKTPMQVLEEKLPESIKAEKLKLSEAAPTVPFSPGAPSDDGTTPAPSFGGPGSEFASRAKEMGLNPDLAGAVTPAPASS